MNGVMNNFVRSYVPLLFSKLDVSFCCYFLDNLISLINVVDSGLFLLRWLLDGNRFCWQTMQTRKEHKWNGSAGICLQKVFSHSHPRV